VNAAKATIAYREMIKWFVEADVSTELGEIVRTAPTAGSSWFSRLFGCFSGPPVIHKELEPERDRAFAYARMRWKEEEEVHLRSIQTIYIRLTQSSPKIAVQRKGRHWEEVGFQGNDPSTDIRVPGTGMLGILQIIWLVSTHLEIARYIHKVSNAPQENLRKFPFVVTAASFTRIAVEAMREGHLNRLFNAAGKGHVLEVLNKLFAASLWQFAKIWDDKMLDIHHFDETYKAVARDAKNNPIGMIEGFDRAIKARNKASNSTSSHSHSDEGPVKFSSMED